jgi:hypothetical protein
VNLLYKKVSTAGYVANSYNSILLSSLQPRPSRSELLTKTMNHFDDIAAIAEGSVGPASFMEAVEEYEKDGVARMIKLWKR